MVPAERERADISAIPAPFALSELPRLLLQESEDYSARLLARQRSLTTSPTVVPPNVQQQLRRRLAACSLAPFLPPICLGRACGLSVSALITYHPRATLLTIVAMLASFSESTIRNARSAWVRLISFAAETQRHINDDGFPAIVVAAFLAHVDSTSRAAAQARNDDRLQQGLQPDLTHLGQTAASTVRASLVWLSDKLKVNLGLDLHVTVLMTEKRLPNPPESPSIKIVLLLEALAMDPTKSDFVRGHAAAWVAKAYAVSRLTQMNMAEFNPASALSGALEFFTRAKHPNHRLVIQRAFWLPTRGLSGSTAWTNPLLTMIADTSLIMRDHNGRGGNPFLATAWKPQACDNGRANASLKALLLHIGVAPADVNRYKSSSFRKFLPSIARARGLPAETRNEIGMWADSASQKAADIAASRKRGRDDAAPQSFPMPDRYSLDAARTQVTTLLQEQIDAAATLAASAGHDNLPLHDGWALLPRATDTSPANLISGA